MTKAARFKRPGRVKSAILSWLGVPIHLTDSEFWAKFSGCTSAGQVVSERTVLSLSAAWACTRLIAESGGDLAAEALRAHGRWSQGGARPPSVSNSALSAQFILNTDNVLGV